MAVYLMRAVGTNRCKIGHSEDVEKRRLSIERGCAGYKLETLLIFEKGEQDAERYLHEWFKENGKGLVGEWFELSPVLIRTIENIMKTNLLQKDEPLEWVRVHDGYVRKRCRSARSAVDTADSMKGKGV